jgi:tRNA threonylcarbamoyl adenosine modification protein YeaZ
MNILALEFSSPQRSVALVGADRQVLAVISEQHGKMTGVAMLESALALASFTPEKIGLVAVGLGPGSYTGIRSAIAIAQGWQLAHGVPVAGVSSMSVLAEEARASGRRGDFRFVIDAQRGEVYTALYRLTDFGPQPLEDMHISSPEPWRNTIGPEASKLVPGAETLFPSAVTLASLARQEQPLAAEELQPIYLRESSFVKAVPPRRY